MTTLLKIFKNALTETDLEDYYDSDEELVEEPFEKGKNFDTQYPPQSSQRLTCIF